MPSFSHHTASAYPAGTSPRPHAPLTAGSRSFTYDGENRPISVSGVTYAYGPDSERI